MNAFLWVPYEAIRGRWRVLSTAGFVFGGWVGSPLQRFCRSPMDFTGDVCKAVLVSQTPGAGNQGLSISLYDMRNAILRDPLFLLPKMSLGFEYSLFRAGQSPFPQSVTMFTHANPQEDEGCSGALWHEGDPRVSMWASMGRLVCPQVSSVEVFLRSCLIFSFADWAATSPHLPQQCQHKANGSGCCSCSSVESLVPETSN